VLYFPSVVIVLTLRFKATRLRSPKYLLSPLTGLRHITLSHQFLDGYHNTVTILCIASTKIDAVTLIVWGFQYPGDLKHFCLTWIWIENALCRPSELKKGVQCGDKAVFNIHFDNEAFATEIFEFAERGEFLPRFQGWEWLMFTRS
jgi:hypothetical protein